MRYSATTGCFYPEWGDYGDPLPPDVVTVPDEDLDLALKRPSNTKVKIVGGRVTIEPIIKTPQELAIETLAAELAEAERVFEEEASLPVTVNGVAWKGGESSASTIMGAVNLAQALGENEVLLVDVNDEEHTLSFADAIQVAARVGKAFRTAYFKKKTASRAAKSKI